MARSRLLHEFEIGHWIKLSTGYYLGLRLVGEFKLGEEYVYAAITDRRGDFYMNFGDLAFANIGTSSRNFHLFLEEKNYILLSWIFRKGVYLHLVPVLIDITNERYCLIEPTRIWGAPMQINLKENKLHFKSTEFVVEEKEIQEITSEVLIDIENMRPISEFYSLKPEWLDVALISYIDQVPYKVIQ